MAIFRSEGASRCLLDYRNWNPPGGGLLQRPAKAPPSGSGTNAFVCSFEGDFDAMQEKIVKLCGIVAFPKFEVPGKCWQGYFVDTEGNTFGIFQPF